MDYDLTDTQKEIVNISRGIAQKKIKPVREHYDKSEEFAWPIVEEFRKADLFGLYIPDKYGGLGGGVVELCLCMEELSRACGGIAMAVGASGLGGVPILLFSTPEQ